MVRIDMDMPDACYHCRLNASGCAAMGRRFYHPLRDEDDEQYDDAKYIVHRMSWCPLKEIVTCKECKYWQKRTQFCLKLSGLNVANRTPPEWYCAGGEKRDGGGSSV